MNFPELKVDNRRWVSGCQCVHVGKDKAAGRVVSEFGFVFPLDEGKNRELYPKVPMSSGIRGNEYKN